MIGLESAILLLIEHVIDDFAQSVIFSLSGVLNKTYKSAVML
jgi:hypothetical protein